MGVSTKLLQPTLRSLFPFSSCTEPARVSVSAVRARWDHRPPPPSRAPRCPIHEGRARARFPPTPSALTLTRRLRATMSGVSLWQFLRPLSAPLRTSVRTSGRSPRPDAECSAELPEYI